MKILITGARGNFATALIPRLAADNIEMALFDVEPMSAPDGSISVQGDVRDAGLLTHAMRGCDAVIHAAAIPADRSEARNEDDFYSVNVTGTHNVLRAMLLNKVEALVYSSTDEVYGDGEQSVRVHNEHMGCFPRTHYGASKLLGEELCRFHARLDGLHIAMLRCGCFKPADWRVAGMGRLRNWVDREDVAQANHLALGAVLAGTFACEPFLIHCSQPFTDADWPALEEDPEKVIERYYPGSIDLLAEQGIVVPHVHYRSDITSAVTTLGYDPQHNFDKFVEQLSAAVRHGVTGASRERHPS